MPKPKSKKDLLIATLEGLGLSENEAILYMDMLGRPRTTVKELSVRAPFPRTMLYYVLNQLIRRGLVAARDEKGKKTVYVVEDPERLYEILSVQERDFKKRAEHAKDVIPKLKVRYRLSGIRPGVRMFEGMSEYTKALEDIILAKPDEVLSYEILGDKKPGLEARAIHEGRRKGRKIKKRVLFTESAHALETLRVRGYDDYTEFRGLKKCPTIDLFLYADKILYTTYYDPHEPTAILVEDHALYMMQKDMFETLWLTAQDHTLLSAKKS